MLTKRIIPCLDVKDGNVVKGIHFLGLKEVGDPVALAKKYYLDGADELVFLDISATVEKRKTMVEVVKKVAKEIFIPFTVGGGIQTVEDVRAMLMAGADKVSLNSAAIRNPSLIKEASERFGNQCVVLAVDAKRRKKNAGWNVYIEGGRKDTGIDCMEWIQKGVSLGAGEILLTSMDADGTKDGFDIELYKAVSKIVNVPVIASGGCGKMEDFVDALQVSDAALAASIFHYDETSVQNVKKYLKEKGVAVRL
ncbi:imidazole glycerol phosphate synthase subunit HisF [Holdemanella biformis]|uniref:imidazole glycerol phosphate synthase subunit HisF n=1 Tax=Holdemanella biformis TaxID=1735 RepID=UPI002E787B97|nr:imidazole glycerol phosphate synthase subunit HisF [Holdemanella biformis]